MRNTSFRGIRPKAMDDTLENNFASYASNCVLYNGAIRPLRAPRYEGQAVDTNGNPLTVGLRKIHIAGDVVVGFNYDTFIAPDPLDMGQVDSFLFVQDGQLMRSSPAWIQDKLGAQKVGICAPTHAPDATPTGNKCLSTHDISTTACIDDVITGECQENKLAVSFLITYVTACGEESVPSAPSETITINTLDELSLFANDTPPDNAVARRWYVAITTGTTANWFFIAETPIEQIMMIYCHSTFSFNEMLQSEDYNHHPPCIEGVSIVGDATTVVWSGKDIWFSEPMQPHAYPNRYQQRIEDNIVAIIPLNDQLIGRGVPYLNVILTDNRPYLMRGTLPENVEITRLNRTAPCRNPMGVLSYESDVFFANEEGLFRVTDATVYDVTNEWFTKEEWSERFNPQHLRIGYYNDRLMAFSTDRDGLMVRYMRENNQHQYDAVYLTPIYESVAVKKGGDLIVANADGSYYSWEQNGDRLICEWRSKLFTQSGLWKPTAGKVIADAHDFVLGLGREALNILRQEQKDCAPFYQIESFLLKYPQYKIVADYLHAQQIDFTLYADDKEVYHRIVRSQKPFRVKRDRKRIYWAYGIKTQTPIREIHVQTSLDDLTNEGGHA